MIAAIAHLIAKPGAEAELERTLRDLIAPSAREPGLLAYAVHRGLGAPSRFSVYERYVDRAAYDSHMASPHVRAALARFPEMLQSPPEVHVLDELALVP